MIEASLYQTIFLIVVVTLCFLNTIPTNLSLEKKGGRRFALLLTLFLMFFIGLRPVSGVFVDMPVYDNSFYRYQELWYSDALLENLRHPTEVGFQLLAVLTGLVCQDSTLFFLTIAVGYFGFMYASARVICCNQHSTYRLLLFYLSCFSVFAFGVNTIRNGLAASIMLYASALLMEDKSNKYACVLGVVAFITHSSVLLPLLVFFLLLHCDISVSKTLYIWFACVVVSLLTGSSLSDFMEGMELFNDERIANYNTEDTHYKIGFRWDFLIYSALPIFVSYYFYKKYNIDNPRFEIVLKTYILCNAFWVLLIRMAFSDRIAYLSWFLYGLLLYLLADSLSSEKKCTLAKRVLLLMNISMTLVICS